LIPLYDDNPTHRFPFTTAFLILANFAVFLYMLAIRGTSLDLFMYRYSAIPWEIVKGTQLPLKQLSYLLGYAPPGEITKNVYLPLFTSMFLHSGWLHILGNMLYLWVFGNNVEDTMGSLFFLGFYLVCGLAGTLAHMLIYPNSITPTLGASGAIAGVLGAYLLLYPRARVYTFVVLIILPLPAFLVIGLWIITQVLYGTASLTTMSGGVAWFAHIGGVTMGLLLTLLFFPFLKRRRDRIIYERMYPFTEPEDYYGQGD
jgi:membrane associated rhomboid family serine protease